MNLDNNKLKKMLCMGHRGAMGHVPENTLLSIETAIEMGADWVEIDVYFVEGKLIVIHDPMLERTTNGEGAIAEQSLAYIRSLDAGEGQQVPLLQEVFDLVDRRIGINIELKGPETAVPVASFIERQIANGWHYDEIIVSSFDYGRLRAVREQNSLIKLGALTLLISEELAQPAAELGAFSVHPWIMAVSEAYVQDAHARGLQVYVFVANAPEQIEQMRRLGVDGLFTNYPDRIVS